MQNPSDTLLHGVWPKWRKVPGRDCSLLLYWCKGKDLPENFPSEHRNKWFCAHPDCTRPPGSYGTIDPSGNCLKSSKSSAWNHWMQHHHDEYEDKEGSWPGRPAAEKAEKDANCTAAESRRQKRLAAKPPPNSNPLVVSVTQKDAAEAKERELQRENERLEAEIERLKAENERVKSHERLKAETERLKAETKRLKVENETAAVPLPDLDYVAGIPVESHVDYPLGDYNRSSR